MKMKLVLSVMFGVFASLVVLGQPPLPGGGGPAKAPPKLAPPAQAPFPPGDPIYVIPPIERQPETSLRADQLAEQRDWGHTNLALEALHAAGHTGEGVVIAICDTGGDPDHPDLKDRFVATGHKDFTGSSSGWRDVQGHGTHCSGIALATKGNGVGVVGAAPSAKLLIQKVLGDQGSGASSWIAGGIRNAADLGADIISLSLGGGSPDTQTRDAIKYAISKGCWVVAAAGNDGGPAVSYPGHYPETIAVCATDRNNARASFSTTNSQNDVSAPGVSILSTLPNDRYGAMSGTSMATPYTAGVLGCVRGAVKKAGVKMPTQSELLAAIAKTSKDLPPSGVDNGTGWGLVDGAKLILEFVGTVPPDPPLPPPPVEGATTVTLPGKQTFILDPVTKTVTLPPGWKVTGDGSNPPPTPTLEDQLKAKGLTPGQIDLILKIIAALLNGKTSPSASVSSGTIYSVNNHQSYDHGPRNQPLLSMIADRTRIFPFFQGNCAGQSSQYRFAPFGGRFRIGASGSSCR